MKANQRTLRWLTIVLLAVAAFFTFGSAQSAPASHHASGKKLTIAFIQIGISQNPFWADQARGASEAARRLGFRIENISGNEKIADQVKRMNDAIDQHVDGIMIIPLDPKSIVPALIRAQKAHIPTLVLYSVAPHATMISGFNEYHSGHIVGVYAATVLKKKFGKVQGRLAILKGALGQTLDTTRTAGFVDVMKKYPGVKIVDEEPTDWDADKAVAVMQDWLVKYPNLTMVYGLSDTITVPAIDVARRSPNGKGILFASIDGDPIGLQAIKKGELLATALYGPIYAGYRFAEMAYKMVIRYQHHQPITPHVTYLRSALVTAHNIDAALRMSEAMSKNIHTFNFDQSLAQAIKEYSR
jgi:ABC-type sugar transport system substrate-binding protein